MRPPKYPKYIDTPEEKIKRIISELESFLGVSVETELYYRKVCNLSEYSSSDWLRLYEKYIAVSAALSGISGLKGSVDWFSSHFVTIFNKVSLLSDIIGMQIGAGCTDIGEQQCLDVNALSSILDNLKEYFK